MRKGNENKNLADGAPRGRRKSNKLAKNQHLTQILAEWEYNAAKTVRRVKMDSGREFLQVRLPLGIEQYEIDGRPDGKRPMNQESWLDYYQEQARRRRRSGEDLSLSDEDFLRLQEEGLLYYYRYLVFFQAHEYQLCARDTRRNLKLLDFVGQHATKEQVECLEQYRPYILRMSCMAQALLKIQEDDDVPGALRLLETGIRAICELPSIPENSVFEFEKTRSLKSLEDLISQLEAHVPRNVALENELKRAIRGENYERAATLRDAIASLRKSLKEE